MYSFANDYSEGAHPDVLEALCKTNMMQTSGYGLDPYCEQAAEILRTLTAKPDADIHFMVGGTQTNITVISAALRPHQAVISAESGHVYVHETGAIEATGHKVLPISSPDGKLTPAQVQAVVDNHTDEHMVQPKMVYISHPTEMGTLYSSEELSALRDCCDQNGLYLYLDGARLASALASEGTDLTLKDLAWYCDVFYIGATKSGALFGEAVVITTDSLKPDFRYLIKRHGGMLAKGRLLGVQFVTLFGNGLYTKIGRHQNKMAAHLRDSFRACGFEMHIHSDTNQQFVILPGDLAHELQKQYKFELFEHYPDGRVLARFVTSWATEKAAIDTFGAYLSELVTSDI